MSTPSPRRRRDPFAEFDAAVRRSFGPFAVRPNGFSGGFVPPVEVGREGDDAVVRLELPGLDIAEDVSVEVDGDALVVRGERRDAHGEEWAGARVREMRYGAFRRSFRLPRHVAAEAVTASYDAGVLTIRIAGAHAGVDVRRVRVTSAERAAEETGRPRAEDSPT